MEQAVIGRLLLACLSTELAEETRTRLAQLSEEDWEQLLRLSVNQRVAPLFYHRLKMHSLERVIPAPLQQQWQKHFYHNAVRNLRLYHELEQLLVALREQSVLGLVLKGAYLAGVVYDNPALRYMVNIDIMIPQQQILIAVKKLLELGYEPLSPLQVEARFATVHHLPLFIRHDRAASIEVHWTITRPDHSYTIAMDELWTRAMPIKLAGVEALGLCPEDLLLHVCLHATYQHHLEQGVRSLCDIDALVRRYEHVIEWEQVQARAHDWGWAKGAYLILYLARQFLATPIPDPVLQSLRPADFTPQIAQEAVTHIFTNKELASTISSQFTKLWSAQGFIEKAKFGMQRLFLSRQMMAQLYPASPHSLKIYLYYAVRLKGLLVLYTSTAGRLRRREPEVMTMISRRNALLRWLEPS